MLGKKVRPRWDSPDVMGSSNPTARCLGSQSQFHMWQVLDTSVPPAERILEEKKAEEANTKPVQLSVVFVALRLSSVC